MFTKEDILKKLNSDNYYIDMNALDTFIKEWQIDAIYENMEGVEFFDETSIAKIKKGISPSNPDKNFAVLNKYSNDIATSIVICMTQKLQPINRNCWLCPVSLL